MPRPVSDRIRGIEAALRERLRSGLYRPGEPFFSNRALAGHYGISYQTAHRILRRLEEGAQ